MPERTLVGRAAEQQQLRTWLGDLREAAGGLAVVQGPAGIGKTSLARWLIDEARRTGVVGLMVAATTPALEPPLGLWSRLAAAAERAGINAGELDAPPEADPDPASRAYRQTLRLLDRIGSSRAVIVLDDLHGADDASLRLLAQLAPALHDMPVLVLAIMRSAQSHPSALGRRALTALLTSPRRLDLAGLDAPAVANLVERLTGVPDIRAWSSRNAATLCRLGDGNPLLLRAMIADLDLRNTGRPDLQPSSTPAAGARTTQAVEARLANLDPAVTEVLALLAHTEDQADLALVRTILHRQVDVEVAAGIDAGVLRRHDGTLGFAHPLFAERLRVSDAGASPEHRLALGKALLVRRRRPTDVILALRHLLAAGEHTPPELLEQAADAVLTSANGSTSATAATAGTPAMATTGGPDQAAAEAEALETLWHMRRHLRRDKRPADDPTRAELGLRAADAHFRAGNRAQSWAIAQEVLDATAAQLRHLDVAVAAAADRPDDRRHLDVFAEAALALSRGQEYAVGGSTVATSLVEVARRLGEDHPATPVLLARAAGLSLAVPVTQATASSRTTGRSDPATEPVMRWLLGTEQARPLVDRAMALLTTRTDPEVAAEVAVCWSRVHRRPDEVAARIAQAERALATSIQTSTRTAALLRVTVDQLIRGQRREVDAALASLRALAASTGDLTARWTDLTLRATIALASGEPARAETFSEQAFAAGEQADEPGRWISRLAQYATGRFLRDGEVIAPPVPDEEFAEWNLLLHAGRAWLAAAGAATTTDAGAATTATDTTTTTTGGAADAAAALLARLIDAVLNGDAGEGNEVLLAALVADAVWAQRAVQHAPVLVDALLPWVDLVAMDTSGDHCHGAAARPLANLLWLTGRRDEAIDMDAHARAINTRAGLTTFVLIGELDAVVRAREDARLGAEQAREQLLALAQRASAAGLGQLDRDARRLASSGLRTRLSTRQLDVLRALAEGLTYAQAGELVGVSHGTARKDAIAAYAALGVNSRGDAVEAARALGLL